MAAGENGDHGPPIALQTVCKKERGREQGQGQERALILLCMEMGLIVKEKTPNRRTVVRTR